MAVYNLGSINADYFYRVDHLPQKGETLTASEHWTGLGGKGANQSVAVAKAGGKVMHIGAVGADGAWAVERMQGYGVDVSNIASVETATAHAIINVDKHGENAIVIYSGANTEQSLARINAALENAGEHDTLVLQNETSMQLEAAVAAKAKGMRVVYSAAPFDAKACETILPHIDILVMNEIESAQLAQATGKTVAEIEVAFLLITKGSEGSLWRDQESGVEIVVPAFKVDPVDTTGAGDCFIGYTIAGMDQGLSIEKAMQLGAAASAIKVTRAGTADAIPMRDEVDEFLAKHSLK